MTAYDLQQRLIDWTAAHSGHDERRPYIGLSGAADCPRVLVARYRQGAPATDAEKMKCAFSYDVERIVVARLRAMGLYRAGVEISAYGGLVKGHTDGGLDDGTIIDVKGVPREEYFPRTPNATYRVRCQLNAYMHYGNRPSPALAIYLARDTGAIRVIPVHRDEALVQVIVQRIESAVAAVQSGGEPGCLCGRCELTAKELAEDDAA